MAILLSSTLINSKPFLPHNPNPKNHNRHGFVISCKSTITTTANLYKILSLNPKESNQEEIKKAYRSMAMKYHPDQNSSMSKEESTRRFIQVHEAYKILSDPILRENYDNELLLMGKTKKGFRATITMADFEDSSRNRWKDQLVELKRRSTHKQGSWASKMMGSQNIY